MSAYTITITIQDEAGRKGKMSFHLPEVSIFSVTEYTREFLTRLEPLHKGAVINVSISFDYRNLDGLRKTPLPGSDILEKMRMQFKTELGHSTAYYIPAFNEQFAAMVYGQKYRILDLLENEPYDFLQMQTDGIGQGLISNICDKRGERVIAIKQTKQTFFKSRIPMFKEY